MTIQQRRIGERGNVVMVGRDIGTVVMPDAGLKIYLTASVMERARRRYEETRARGQPANLEQIMRSMKRRDAIDSSRMIAPLKPAPDAIVIDSDDYSIDEVVMLAIDYYRNTCNNSEC
jgi:cytidylate kinase